jgi:type IV pilus assembly protein PilA
MSTRARAGFTLIELLIVVVIIGILAGIAIPKFGETRSRANEAAVKSDLRNLLTAQETYFGDNGTTYGAVTSIQTGENLWAPGAGVAVAISPYTSSFIATATKSGKICTMTYWNTGASAVEATNGVPTCN